MKNSADKRFIIMRHEMTQENKIGLIQGQSIGGTLVSKEINQEKLRWCKKNILLSAVVVSSSSPRSVKSASILAKSLDLPISTLF